MRTPSFGNKVKLSILVQVVNMEIWWSFAITFGFFLFYESIVSIWWNFFLFRPWHIGRGWEIGQFIITAASAIQLHQLYRWKWHHWYSVCLTSSWFWIRTSIIGRCCRNHWLLTDINGNLSSQTFSIFNDFALFMALLFTAHEKSAAFLLNNRELLMSTFSFAKVAVLLHFGLLFIYLVGRCGAATFRDVLATQALWRPVISNRIITSFG